MTEKRFNYTSEKIGQHWGIEISDNQTKQPFDVDYIEITDNYSQTKDNVKFIVELLNELHETNEQLQHDATILIQSNQDYRKENEELKHSIKCLEADKMELQQYIKRMQGDVE